MGKTRHDDEAITCVTLGITAPLAFWAKWASTGSNQGRYLAKRAIRHAAITGNAYALGLRWSL